MQNREKLDTAAPVTADQIDDNAICHKDHLQQVLQHEQRTASIHIAFVYVKNLDIAPLMCKDISITQSGPIAMLDKNTILFEKTQKTQAHEEPALKYLRESSD